MTDGPMRLWRDKIDNGALDPDPEQAAAVEKLERLHRRLARHEPPRPARGFRLFGRGDAVGEEAPEGLYIYGGVGRGKSMLMDLFFANAPLSPKRRVHFHAFMQEVQKALHAARQSGRDEPILTVAADIAKGARLLCFDEIEVRDIADAMILGRLFEALFARGVVVVATSNRHPDELYKNGLNRQLFLPFIAELKARMDIHELGGAHDHRGRDALPHWLSPLGPQTDQRMDAIWETLTGGAEAAARPVSPRLTLQGAGGYLRASFPELCARPLGPGDFLALAEAGRGLMLEGIPLLGRDRVDETRRFVTLIDSLYEARAPIYCSAEGAPEALCASGDWAFEFARTASRLGEMTAKDWPDRQA